jgi:molybdopterin/thiamine biosynthesis adenylyltransferase
MNESYKKLTLRNNGYINHPLQKKLSECKILIAGCGVGSTIAELASRMGFQNFVLVDGDTVEQHNLNRQAFTMKDVGNSKVSSLAKRILDINPEAKITEIFDWVTKDNVAKIVADVDLVFDTIDFLDLEAITSLHDECRKQQRPIFSAISAGWGAGLMVFPNIPEASPCTFRELFGLPATGSVADCSYIKHFANFFQHIAGHLDPKIVQAMSVALTVMEDGKPCPAPHVAPGSYSVATLALTAATRFLNGEVVCFAPELLLVDLSRVCSHTSILLTAPATEETQVTAN